MNKIKLIYLLLGMGCQVKWVDKTADPSDLSLSPASELQVIHQLKSQRGQVDLVHWQIRQDQAQPEVFELRLHLESQSQPRWFLLSQVVVGKTPLPAEESQLLSLPASKVLPLLPGDTQLFKVTQGSRWQLTIFCSQVQAASECNQTQIAIPSVLILKKAQILKQDFIWKGDFLVLASDAVILTQGFAFEVEAQHLRAEPGAFIGTFKAQQVSNQTSRAGLTPLPIRVIANYAEGHLQMISRGQDGSAGADPVWPATPQAQAAIAGDSGQLGERRSPIADLPGEVYCRQSPSPGTPGQAGLDGQKGGDGGDAGGSGLVELKVQNPMAFTYQLNQLPGEPGRGGKASPPQKGGVAKVTSVHRECEPSGQIVTPGGQDGKSAPDGLSGRPNIKPAQFCVILGRERRGCN